MSDSTPAPGSPEEPRDDESPSTDPVEGEVVDVPDDLSGLDDLPPAEGEQVVAPSELSVEALLDDVELVRSIIVIVASA